MQGQGSSYLAMLRQPLSRLSRTETGIISRWQPRVVKSQLEFIKTNWQTCLFHLSLWTVLCVASFLFICLSYMLFYSWYIPAERISHPVYFHYERDSPSYSIRINNVQPDIPYDISLRLLVPDISGLSESLGNVMISTTVTSPSTSLSSSRPTLLVYRSWPVRMGLLWLRMIPVVLGLAKEATEHRVFLMEQLTVLEPEILISLSMGRKIPLYETTLEMVAHFRGLRYLMYYWKWVTAAVVVGSTSSGVVLLITVILGVSLYRRLHPDSGDDQSDSSSTTTTTSNDSASVINIGSRPRMSLEQRLRRRRVATDGQVPNGDEESSSSETEETNGVIVK